VNNWRKQPTESPLALVKECEQETAVHAPGLLEEARGIADAYESEYDLVLANVTVGYWELSACNVIAVSGNRCRKGGTVFARNHDWLEEDQEWGTCFRTHSRTRHTAYRVWIRRSGTIGWHQSRGAGDL
jgi:hypothetical protein